MGSGGAGGMDGKASRDRAPRPRAIVRIDVPIDFPEVTAHRAGRRLFNAEADDVATLLRSGFFDPGYLEADELAAYYSLGQGPFTRWLVLGWKAGEAGEGS